VRYLQSVVFRICLRCLIVISLFSSSARAGDRKAEPRPTITVLVYNYAQASTATLAGAEREAGRILGEAGVRSVWLVCLGLRDDEPQQPCQKVGEPIDVVLRVLPGSAQNTSRDTRLGFAILPALASVYYEYAVRLTKSDDVKIELPIILGCAIAHELGHLLLGPNNHSIAGIMEVEWKPEQLRLALKGWLLFTYQQSKLIRAEARRRMRLQTEGLKERHIVTVDQSLSASWAGAPVIIGATRQQERFLTCIVQLSDNDLRNTPNSNEHMTVIVLEHQIFLEMREAFHAHKTKLAFSSLQARRIYLSARMFGDFETLLRCITHELGHFATQSVYEDHAERAAGRIRQMVRQRCRSPLQ